MNTGLTKQSRVAKNRNMRRMLIRQYKRQSYVLKFKHGPGGVLIFHFAVETFGVPRDRFPDIFYAERRVMQSVQIRFFAHGSCASLIAVQSPQIGHRG